MLARLLARAARVRRRLHRVPKIAGIAPYDAHDGVPMHAYWSGLDSSLAPFANPFAYYEELVRALARLPATDLVPVSELMTPGAPGRRRVALRHDLDADPLTGLRAARFLARLGVCGSFYLLHTASYYANPHGSLILRNPQLAEWVRGFIVSGCELGLHNDALGVYRNWARDGVAALLTELEYLRALGANVRGTVAHNSGPAYGAENYELFAGRQLWKRPVGFGAVQLRLGCISEAALGLSYEGTFAVPKKNPEERQAKAFFADGAAADVRSERWMRRYLLDNPCCDWAVDCQVWLLGKDRWVAAGRRAGIELFEWDANLDTVLRVLRDLPAGSRTLLVVHPEYVRA